MAKKKEEPADVPLLRGVETIDGEKWIPGTGHLPCDYMLVGDRPTEEDRERNNVFVGNAGSVMFQQMNQAGFDFSNAWFTYAVKYLPFDKRTVSAGDIKKCKPYLMKEIKECKPKVIVTLGSNAFKAVMGRGYTLADHRGTFIDGPEEAAETRVFPMYSPSYMLRKPDSVKDFRRDLMTLVQDQRGEVVEKEKLDYEVLTTVRELEQFRDYILAKEDRPLLSIDMEWDGVTWMAKDRYVRTVQIGYGLGAAVVIEMTGVGGAPVMDDADKAWLVLKELFENEYVDILGQNAIADGQWLMSYGIDIRSRVVYDTMLAEHTINSQGPFNLTDMTCKYTNMGRYDIDVIRWVKAHPKECVHGYGMVPRELLIPYGAKDVDAPRRIAMRQMEELEEYVGPRGKYPSLWQTALNTQRNLYEVEGVGMRVDKKRLFKLREQYTKRLIELESVMIAMVKSYGLDNFNHRSVPQVRKLLFDPKMLSLQPVKTTTGRSWTSVHGENQRIESTYTPSTDSNTLEILQTAHPIVKMLLNIRRLDTIVKTFLKHRPGADESSKGGGIESKIWPDGRIHPRFSQLSDTGRFRTSKPNCQNFPKKAEGYMEEIFGGKDKTPESIRTVVVPEDGCVLMEADFKQAELFVLAYLSGDQTMRDTLTTPGKDMHDMTAITSFGLVVLGPDNKPIDEQILLDLAAKDEEKFKELQSQLIYVDQQGKRMTRSVFKNTLRISSKNLNFGVCRLT